MARHLGRDHCSSHRMLGASYSDAAQERGATFREVVGRQRLRSVLRPPHSSMARLIGKVEAEPIVSHRRLNITRATRAGLEPLIQVES